MLMFILALQAAVWIMLYFLADRLADRFAEGPAVRFMRTNRIWQGFSLCSAAVFPIVLSGFLTGVIGLAAVELVWTAFYSGLLVVISFKNKGVRLAAVGINLLCFWCITVMGTMGGSEAAVGLTVQSVLPFLYNPWLN